MSAAVNDPKILNQSKEVRSDDSEVRSDPTLNFYDSNVSQTVQTTQLRPEKRIKGKIQLPLKMSAVKKTSPTGRIVI